MRTFEYTITDEVGIHARPAGLLVNESKKFVSSIILTCKGKSADTTKLMALMALGVRRGDSVQLEITGEDEDKAAEALERFFKENL